MSAPLALEEAQARLLALATALPAEPVAVTAMLGRYLAEDMRAARTQPYADLSAMDGYALSPGTGPWRCMGESRAGMPFAGVLGPEECVRISTGAALPEGAGAVLIEEEAEVVGALVSAQKLPPPLGHYVRPRGLDFDRGDILLPRGSRMNAVGIALALAGGHTQALAARAVRVAVIECGDELAADPAACLPHQLPASNGAMIAAMLAPLGCLVTRIGPVPDDAAALACALAEADSADLIITSGGASIGPHDLVKPALAQWGAETAFWKVAIKPGKPLLVAARGAQVVVGLPGNPVSSFVTAFLFVLPLVRTMLGAAEAMPRPEWRIVGDDLPAVGPRREFLRARTDGVAVRLTGSQDSSALTALAAADCLIDRPAHAPALASGAPVPVFPLHIG